MGNHCASIGDGRNTGALCWRCNRAFRAAPSGEIICLRRPGCSAPRSLGSMATTCSICVTVLLSPILRRFRRPGFFRTREDRVERSRGTRGIHLWRRIAPPPLGRPASRACRALSSRLERYGVSVDFAGRLPKVSGFLGRPLQRQVQDPASVVGALSSPKSRRRRAPSSKPLRNGCTQSPLRAPTEDHHNGPSRLSDKFFIFEARPRLRWLMRRALLRRRRAVRTRRRAG